MSGEEGWLLQVETKGMRMAFLLLTWLFGAALDAQTYPIHLDRKDTPGEMYVLTATGSQRSLISVGERTAGAEEYRVSFVGRAKIEEVDGKGSAYKIRFTVTRFTKTSGDRTEDVLMPGTVIVADGSRDENLALESGVLGRLAKDAFSTVYTAHKPNSTTDDEIFGTKEARSVGESWPINASLAAESAAKDAGMVIPVDQLSGSTKFVALDNVGDAECARVESQMSADNFSGKNAPMGVLIKKGSVDATFGGCFPVKVSVHSYRSSSAFHLNFEGSLANGKPLEGSLDAKSETLWSEVH